MKKNKMMNKYEIKTCGTCISFMKSSCMFPTRWADCYACAKYQEASYTIPATSQTKEISKPIMKEQQSLADLYARVAEAYARELVNMYFTDEEGPYDYQWEDSDHWLLNVADNLFTLNDIRYIVDNNVPYETWSEWDRYCQRVSQFDIQIPNLHSWHHGCPRMSEEHIRRLEDMKTELLRLIDEEKERMKKHTKNEDDGTTD